ncbi:MAG: 2TM domain-containing protein [Candidatus Margulisbacteria bacterium]|jgi:hypothetical protein|nr:2TM domain-containing protein [Candidatus Margulisiibacteriota bacterium]
MDERQKALAKFISRAFFYFHFFIYTGINIFLITVNKVVSPEIPWFILPLSVWGIFLFLHFGIHFFIESATVRKWRRARLEKIEPGPLEKGLGQEELKKRRSARLFFWLAFYFHLSTYALVVILLLLIQYLVFHDYFWVSVFCAAWGIFILIHYLLTLAGFSARLENWRSGQILKLNGDRPRTAQNIREATLFFGFRVILQAHIILFSLVILALIILARGKGSASTGWLLYPFCGWGIILLAHWLVTGLITRGGQTRLAD